MARKLCPFLLLLVVFLSCSCTSAEESGCVVKIRCDGGAAEVYGTGCLLDGGYILTAAHIIAASWDGTEICTVAKSDGETERAEIIFVDEASDLALLRSSLSGGMRLSGVLPGKGSRATVLGADGEVSAVVSGTRECVAPDKPPLLIQLETYLPKGMSGAPVIDKKGAVTGMVCARSIDGQFAYAIPAGTVSAFIKKALSRSLSD